MVAMWFREGVAVLVVVFCSVVVRATAQEGKQSYNVRNALARAIALCDHKLEGGE